MSRTPSPPATKRLLKELQSQNQEPRPFLSSLGPVSDEQFLRWRAVMKGVPRTAYESGSWELDIEIPEQYPLQPPVIHFLTKIVHPNVAFQTGEICLDLLKDRWNATYTVSATLEAIHQLLAYPAIDSPLNLEVANMLRDGDEIGAEGLIRYFCWSNNYMGR